jgi:hypothetical protein
MDRSGARVQEMDRMWRKNLGNAYTPRVAMGIVDQWIAWYDDVDNKMFVSC